jgi:hypothetical protein
MHCHAEHPPLRPEADVLYEIYSQMWSRGQWDVKLCPTWTGYQGHPVLQGFLCAGVPSQLRRTHAGKLCDYCRIQYELNNHMRRNWADQEWARASVFGQINLWLVKHANYAAFRNWWLNRKQAKKNGKR